MRQFSRVLLMRTAFFACLAAALVISHAVTGTQASSRAPDSMIDDGESEFAIESLAVNGQTGGYVGVTATDGRLVVMGVGPRLFVLDLLFPDEPLIVGQTDLLRGVVTGATISGNLAYLAAGLGGLVIVDLTDPTNPHVLSRLDTSDHVHGIAVDSDRAYLLNAFSELLVVDVSQPATPRQIGAMEVSGGIPAAVAAVPGYAYITARQDPWSDGSLAVIQVTDPTRPIEIASLPTEGSANDVALSGDHAYVANGDAGLLVVDVSNPAAPLGIAEVEPGWSSSSSVRLFGTTAYLTDFAFGLQIVDVTTPALPSELGWLDLPNGAEDVAVFDDYAYIADGMGLQVGDVSDPSLPAIAGSVPAGGPMLAEAVTVSDDVAYVGDDFRGLSVLSVSDVRRPREVGVLPIDLPASDVAVDADVAFLASGSTTFDAPPDGMVTVVSVTDPETPVQLSMFATGGAAAGVAASAGTLYVGDGTNGLRVYDASDPTNCREVGSVQIEGASVGKLHIDFDRAVLLAVGINTGLLAFDVSDTANPSLLATLPLPGETRAVTADGNTAYVAVGSEGLRIVDVTDPTSPRVIGSIDTDSHAQGVAVDGETVVVADGGGLVMVDVSVPSAPQRTSTLALADSARAVVVQRGTTFVAAEAAGLYTIGGAGPVESVWLPVASRGFTFN